MGSVPMNCRDIDEVGPFCDCISGEGSVDTAIRDLCERAADSSGQVTGDDLAKLKEELESDTDPDDCCCEC